MKTVLLCATTTGYQSRAFDDASQRFGIALVHASDACHQLHNPWRNNAIAVHFDNPVAAARTVLEALDGMAIDGVLAIGEAPATVAAIVAEERALPWHSPAGTAAARDKIQARGRFLAAGLPVPWFVALHEGDSLASVAPQLRFPCVVKPSTLSASRGVMRVDTFEELERAIERVRRLLRGPDLSSPNHRSPDVVLIEGYIPGREYALEGAMDRGSLHVFAIFDKPDPLDGPFFEETIYVTPPLLSEPLQRAIAGVTAHAALALGLFHGPVHAECRVNENGIFMLEVAARPIGGLCARSLRFVGQDGGELMLEELLLHHAAGGSLEGYAREPRASGVMMIPVPGRGHLRRVDGVDEAARVAGIEDVVVTAKAGQLLEPWPEGHSYPGFIFGRAALPEQVTAALHAAHARLRFVLDASLPLTPGR